MGWSSTRRLLNAAVPRHLGEDLTLSVVGTDAQAAVRGVLTRPEELQRLGVSTVTVGQARLTLRKEDAPAWLARGVAVTSEASETFEVTYVTDNGEGLLEVTLCRSS